MRAWEYDSEIPENDDIFILGSADRCSPWSYSLPSFPNTTSANEHTSAWFVSHFGTFHPTRRPLSPLVGMLSACVPPVVPGHAPNLPPDGILREAVPSHRGLLAVDLDRIVLRLDSFPKSLSRDLFRKQLYERR